MTISFPIVENGYHLNSCFSGKPINSFSEYKVKLKPHVDLATPGTLFNRRQIVLCTGASLVAVLTLNCGFFTPLSIKAEENAKREDKGEEDEGIFEPIKSLFDPNEKTKSGKLLPKAYLKSAREVVESLRESLKEDVKDIAKFRKTADAAKGSIREYLNGWKGQQKVVAEESYVAIEKAIRSLASFYSKAGPFAALPEEVRSRILDDLNTAEASL